MKHKRTTGELLIGMSEELLRRIDMARAAAPVGSDVRNDLANVFDIQAHALMSLKAVYGVECEPEKTT